MATTAQRNLWRILHPSSGALPALRARVWAPHEGPVRWSSDPARNSATTLRCVRVVSLLPSATEILCAIGGKDLLVGRSHECDFPDTLGRIPVLTGQRTLGGTSAQIDAQVSAALGGGQSLYTLDADRLRALAPDVILTQDLCDVCSIDLGTVRSIAATMTPTPTIVSLNPTSLWQVLDDVLVVGSAIGREAEAQACMVALREGYWTAIDFVNPYIPGPPTLFLEWMDPPFVGGHWTPALVEAAGAPHVLNAAGAKSRRVAPEEILEAAPERIIICPCGFDLKRIERELPALLGQRWWPLLPAVLSGDPNAIVLVDGNQMFNRPGPRLVEAFRWLVGWLNDRPELVPAGFPVRRLADLQR